MVNPEIYLAENIIYDWNKYKKKYYKKLSKEIMLLWNSRKKSKRLAVIGFAAILISIGILSLLTVLLILNIIAQYLIPYPIISQVLNFILNFSYVLFLTIGSFSLIIGVICLLCFAYLEHDAIVHGSEFYRYWSPKFADFLNNRFDNKLLLSFIDDHIAFLESEQARLAQLAQSIIITILLNIVLVRLTEHFELFSIGFLVVIICVVFAVILVLSSLQRAIFLFNGASYSKLLRAREVKMLLQLEILLTDSRSDDKIEMD